MKSENDELFKKLLDNISESKDLLKGYLKEIDEGRTENIRAPKIAIDYYNLPKDAKLRDVVIAVRKDEEGHRDVNHDMADQIRRKRAGLI